MAKIRMNELDQLVGEVLPERTVLSALPSDPGGAAPFSPFCSPNDQSNSVAGSIIASQGANNQCGLTNNGEAFGGALL
jgi:hypothetical protein